MQIKTFDSLYKLGHVEPLMNGQKMTARLSKQALCSRQGDGLFQDLE